MITASKSLSFVGFVFSYLFRYFENLDHCGGGGRFYRLQRLVSEHLILFDGGGVRGREVLQTTEFGE